MKKKGGQGVVDTNKLEYSRELTYLYQVLNKRHYGGQLPNIEVYWGPLPAPKGKFKYGVTGLIQRKGRKTRVVYIVLNRKLRVFSQSTMEMFLLHEIIHARYPDADHGKVFKSEVRRLIRRGALDNII